MMQKIRHFIARLFLENKLLSVLTILAIAVIVSSAVTYFRIHDPRLQQVVSDAIMSHIDHSFGECETEGHVIFLAKRSNMHLTVYTLVSYSEFGFQNGIFTRVCGGSNIPAVISFDINRDGSYSLSSYEEAKDGSLFRPSVRNMFPFYLRPFVLSRLYTDDLDQQQEAYAEKYLASIGRDAMVQAAPVEHQLGDMETQASNRLLSLYNVYPYWVGTVERIENGTRYVYQKEWQSSGNGDGVVSFIKSVYDSQAIVEKTVIQIKNSEIIYLEGIDRTQQNNVIAEPPPVSTEPGVKASDPYYELMLRDDGNYTVILYDDNHKETYRLDYLDKGPGICYVDGGLICITLSNGTNNRYSTYYDVDSRMISDTYWNPVYLDFGRLAYLEDGKLIIRDIFDPSVFYEEILRNFAAATQDAALFRLEFLDDHTLLLEYPEGGEYTERQETIYFE